MKVVLATHNKDKRKEILPLLKPMGFEVLTLDKFPEIGDIIEDGSTLTENALIKARTVNQITGLPTIADDTGLEVDALKGRPGIYSARFAGEGCRYSDNVNKLISEMNNIPENKRTARFRTVTVFTDGKQELIAEGTVEGFITQKIKGVGGFGYDPVFYIPKSGKTFAEMTLDEKKEISHRGRAFRNMGRIIEQYLNISITKENA
jgi:XTP/dITP diphosphohydrolase